ncbi:hypothetical protein C8J56DRAFT_953962 [Mycena floridula]|nr:hypothetical protein C8J56DRAFT_953962 [Mycena floridula]
MGPETNNDQNQATSSQRKSCNECRRSKLKCDRVFPCSACIRRGCASICPDGRADTDVRRVLTAQAQRLTDQVNLLTARVQELETRLAQTENRSNLSKEEIDAIYDKGLATASEAIGSLSIRADGKTKYLKELLPTDDQDVETPKINQLDLPDEVVELSNSFPFGIKDHPYGKCLFAPYIPPKEQALRLIAQYYDCVAWMYDPIVRQDFDTLIFNPLYDTPIYPIEETIHAHLLSIFFIALADGALHDSHNDPTSARFLAEQYHCLSRACLAHTSVLEDATFAAVQATFMMVRFVYDSDRSSNEHRWMLTGICAKLAQTVNRDSAGWHLDPEEQQRRRRMFWSLYMYDAWTSLVHGRPPTFMIQHSDCQFPIDLEPSVKASGETELGYYAYMFRYAASCLSISVQHAFTVKNLNYEGLLDLDKKIRTFPISSHLQCPMEASEAGRSWSPEAPRAMQQYCILCERESNLLYIHRSYFAKAIREAPEEPCDHNMPLRACRLISSLRGIYSCHPDPTSRCWFFWSGVFSSCVVFGALIVESPGCRLTEAALRELEQGVLFYEQGSALCRPMNTMNILRKLLVRAQDAFANFLAGVDPMSTTPDSSAPDELEVLGGRKSVITSSKPSSSKGSSARESKAGSISPPQSDASPASGPSEVYYHPGQTYETSFPEVVYPVQANYMNPYLAGRISHSESNLRQVPYIPVGSYQYNITATMSNSYVDYGAIMIEPTQDEVWRNFEREFGLS